MFYIELMLIILRRKITKPLTRNLSNSLILLIISVERFIGNTLDVSLGVWYIATKGIILLKNVIVTNTRYTSCC
jgi:hypothetical protein